MGITLEVFGCIKELNCAIIRVDEYYRVFFCFALNLHCIPTAEFQVGTEVSAHIGVDWNSCHGRKTYYKTFTGTGIISVPTDRTDTDYNLIFGIIPLCFRSGGIPEKFEAKTFSAGKAFFHVFCYRFCRRLSGTHIHMKCTHGVSLFNGFGLKSLFIQQLEVFLVEFAHVVTSFFRTDSASSKGRLEAGLSSFSAISKALAGHVFTQAPQATHLNGVETPGK